MLRRHYMFLLGFLFLTLSLQAQKPEFTASAPSSVKKGQQFQYTIQGNEQATIVLPELENFDLLGGPFSSLSTSTQWVNGKMTAQTIASYTYILRANKEGSYKIPPAIVKIKRESIETNSVSINVGAPSASGSSGNPGSSGRAQTNTGELKANEDDQVFLRIHPSQKSVYIGEQLISELKVYTSVNTRPTGGLKEIPYEGFYKQTLAADQISSRENINGKLHVTQVLQRHILIPQKAGKLRIEPYESEWTIPQRLQSQRSRSLFDDFFDDTFSDPFFDRVQNIPVPIKTKPVTIDVKALPPGAPEGFTGGVGDFKFSAKLSDQELKVNDALSLEVRISGTGNLPLLGAPEVNFPPEHDVYETSRSSSISSNGNRLGGTLTFEYPLVVRSAGTFRIPPLKFSWFDPDEETYRSITTDEFVFTVEKGEDNGESSGVFVPGIRGEAVEDLGTDILDIERFSDAFTPIAITPLRSTIYWMGYLAALLLFLASVIMLRGYLRQRADVRLTRNRKANKLARKRLYTADRARKSEQQEKFYEETEKAIWGYISDKLDIDQSVLSRDSAREVLQKADVPSESIEELLRIIDECEFSRYSPSAEKAGMDTLYSQSVKLINNLEQQIRRR